MIGTIIRGVIRRLSRVFCAQAQLTQGAEYASVGELARRMSQPEGLSCVALVQYLLLRIQHLDKQGPSINAIIELNSQAMDIARQRDRERLAGTFCGPLHGIPVLLKDNIHTADQMQTSAGSMAMVGQPAAQDAFIVRRLREMGAVILGKTNMSELAGFCSSNAPDGWSSRGGQTRNPHKLDADVGGSSSGSAAAVAAGFAPLAVGTETSGSLIVPAALNGIVGLKPSVGLLSRSGIIPACNHQDTPGPMARTVHDVALLLNAMTGVDSSDHAGQEAPQNIDYTQALTRDSLNGKRIGFPVLFAGEPVNQSPSFSQVLAVLVAQGAVVVPVNLRAADASRYDEALLADVKHELDAYLATREGLPINCLEQLVAFNDRHSGQGAYNQQTLKLIMESTSNVEERANLWRIIHQDFRHSIDAAMAEYQLDALVSDYENNLYFAVAAAGYPGISVPSGCNAEGLPTAAFFFGSRWSEDRLLALAYGYEQAANVRCTPVFY